MITASQLSGGINSSQIEEIPWKILVVDDEASIRRIVAFRLQQNGYQILTATNGVEALEMFNQTLPDLVIVDLMLPEMSGFELTEQIRKKSYVPLKATILLIDATSSTT